MYIPGMAPTVFINPNTLPECFGARSDGFTAIALLWKPEPPIINARQIIALWKVSTFAEIILNLILLYNFLRNIISIPKNNKLMTSIRKHIVSIILRVAVTEYPALIIFSERALPKNVQGNIDSHGTIFTTQP